MADIGFEANIIENHDEPRGVNTYLPPHAQNDAGEENVSDGGDNASGTAVFVPGREIGMETAEWNR